MPFLNHHLHREMLKFIKTDCLQPGKKLLTLKSISAGDAVHMSTMADATNKQTAQTVQTASHLPSLQQMGG
jgi:hypothetical protein